MRNRQGYPVSNLHVCLNCRAIAADTDELFHGAKKCAEPHTVPYEPRDIAGAFFAVARELSAEPDDYAGVLRALLDRTAPKPLSEDVMRHLADDVVRQLRQVAKAVGIPGDTRVAGTAVTMLDAVARGVSGAMSRLGEMVNHEAAPSCVSLHSQLDYLKDCGLKTKAQLAESDDDRLAKLLFACGIKAHRVSEEDTRWVAYWSGDVPGAPQSTLARALGEGVVAGGEIARGTIERLNRKLHDLKNDWQAEKLRADAAEANYARLAHVLGIEHAPDTGPSHPGPVEACEESIRRMQHAENKVTDMEVMLEAAAIDARCVARLLGVVEDGEEVDLVESLKRAENAALMTRTMLGAYADTEKLAAEVRKELYPDQDPAVAALPQNPASIFRVLQQRHSGAVRTIQAATQYLRTLMPDEHILENDIMRAVQCAGAWGAKVEQSRRRLASILGTMAGTLRVAMGDLHPEEEGLVLDSARRTQDRLNADEGEGGTHHTESRA